MFSHDSSLTDWDVFASMSKTVRYTRGMTQPKVIAILGMPGSGKGTVVGHICSTYHTENVYLGGMVYEEVRRRGLDIVADERAVREDMRAKEGPAVLAKRAAARAEELVADGARFVVFDGVYSWSEDKYLRETYGNDYISVAIVNPKLVRYERVVARKDAHRPYTKAQIQLRDIEEIENLEKGGPIAFADYYIANAPNIAALTRQTDELMNRLFTQ